MIKQLSPHYIPY